MFEKIKKKLESDDRYAHLTGITVLEAGPGTGKVSMELTPELRNSVGSVHGGALFTLADMAFSVAANAGQENAMISTNASISFMKGSKSGPITAQGRLLNGGKTLATFQIDIFDGEGTQVAAALISGFRLNTPIFPQKVQS